MATTKDWVIYAKVFERKRDLRGTDRYSFAQRAYQPVDQSTTELISFYLEMLVVSEMSF